MKFKDLFKNLKNVEIKGDQNLEIKALTSNLDDVVEGSCYIAYDDTKKKEINDAIKKGAVAIVVSKKRQISDEVTYAFVSDIGIAKAAISSTFYDNPSTKMKVIGVLGDEQRLIASMLITEGLMESGKKVGIITKRETGIRGKNITRENILDSLFIQKKLYDFEKEKIEYAVLEIPLESVANNDVLGCKFEEILLTKTNINTDNFKEKLEGGSIEEFLEKHYKIFKWSDFNVLNNDDLLSDEIKKISKKHITYGISNESDYNAFDINLRNTRVDFLVRIQGSVERVIINIPGMDTVEAALGALRQFNVFRNKIKTSNKSI